jgi:hypothetical protein
MSDDATRKLIHDLRNALGPAMMAAEALCRNADPSVQRYSKVVLDSLDNATALMRVAASRNES